MGCSNDNYWKLDKWDKIGIASLIVFFTIFVVLNTFSFGAVSVDLIEKNGLSSGLPNGVFISNPLNKGFYFRVYKGVTYHFVSNDSVNAMAFCFTYDVPDVGVDYYNRVTVSPDYTFSFDSDGYVYAYILQHQFVPDFTITTDVDNYMLFSMDRLGDLTFVGLWDTFKKTLPFVLVVVLFAFGIYLISHAIKEVSRGRDL